MLKTISKAKLWGFAWLFISGSYFLYKYKEKEIRKLFVFILKGRNRNKNENVLEGKKQNERKQKSKTKKKKEKEKEEEIERERERENVNTSSEKSELTDIEDINNLNYRNTYKIVQIKNKKKKGKSQDTISTYMENEHEKNKKFEYANKTTENVIIPEKYKIYFKSFGCAHNSSDSEFMMGLLSNYGFKFVKNVEDCDICIINSCTVKNPSEESMKTIINYVKKLNGTFEKTNKNKKDRRYTNPKENRRQNGKFIPMNKTRYDSDCFSTSTEFSEIEETSIQNSSEKNDPNSLDKKTDEKTEKLFKTSNKTCATNENGSFCTEETKNEKKEESQNKRKQNIKLIVCGCVPQAEKDMEIFENISLVGVSNIDKIVEVVENVINGYNVKYLKMNKQKMTSLSLPKIRKNKFIEIVNINNGCLGNCTYCKTKFARGDLLSYTIQDIIERIEYVINEEHIKEIWLTSEDTGAYGIDLKTNIVELLKEILKTIENTNVMVRLGMTNPPYIANHIMNICELLKHKNMYEFIHIPVQSGSNNVLKNMKREYKIEDFIFLVENLKKNVTNVTIATDIICGFPYETDEDHQETINLIKKYKFPIINISQFYPRSGTVAFNMKKINTQIVKKRSKEVTETFLSYDNNYDYLKGTLQNVLFTDVSSRSEHIIGHTKQYVKVLLPNENNKNLHLLGNVVLCKIVITHKWHIMAELCNQVSS